MQHKTKLTLAAAVAMGISNGANAIHVSATVTELQIYLGLVDIMAEPESSFSGMIIGGDTDASIGLTLEGDMVAFVSDTYLGMSWDLTNGIRQGVNGSGGTSFQGGTISISTSTDGVIYSAYQTIDASVTSIDFLAGEDGHLLAAPSQTTAGLIVNDSGGITFPGLWGGDVLGSGFNNAVGTMNLFSNSAGIFMEGTQVPLPAAAWMFASALFGLAGLGRRRGR